MPTRPAERKDDPTPAMLFLSIRGYCLFACAHLDDEILAMLRDRANRGSARP